MTKTHVRYQTFACGRFENLLAKLDVALEALRNGGNKIIGVMFAASPMQERATIFYEFEA